MSSREYTRWMIWFSQEPPLVERMNYYCANIAATVANSVRRKGAAYKIKDFLLSFRDRPRRDNAQALEAKWNLFVRQYNRQFEKQGSAK